MELEYRVGKNKFETPSQNIVLLLSYSNLYDTKYYEANKVQLGSDMTIGLRYTAAVDHGLSTHQFDIEIQQSFHGLGGLYDYSKITASGYNDFAITNRLSLTTNINAGVIEGMFPLQTGLFLSPTGRFVFSDFGSFAGHRLYYDQMFSGGLAGYINENLTGRYLLSARVEWNINILNHPKIPIEPLFVNFFIEGAKLWKSKNGYQTDRSLFLDAGFGFKIVGFTVLFPLWKNFQVVKNEKGDFLQSDNKIEFNSILMTADLTYLYKYALEMK
jgi:hypothetical protein